MPIQLICSTDGLLCLRSATTSFWHNRCRRGPSTPTRRNAARERWSSMKAQIPARLYRRAASQLGIPVVIPAQTGIERRVPRSIWGIGLGPSKGSNIDQQGNGRNQKPTNAEELPTIPSIRHGTFIPWRAQPTNWQSLERPVLWP